MTDPIPNPGTMPSPSTWISDGLNGTPQTAMVLGIVTATPVYLGNSVNAATGASFYVFKTGPSYTAFSADISGAGTVDYVHMHDGANLMFGAEIPASVHTGSHYEWNSLQTNHVYVFEVHMTGGIGF
jgi:hypothetical protein